MYQMSSSPAPAQVTVGPAGNGLGCVYCGVCYGLREIEFVLPSLSLAPLDEEDIVGSLRDIYEFMLSRGRARVFLSPTSGAGAAAAGTAVSAAVAVAPPKAVPVRARRRWPSPVASQSGPR